MDSFRPFSSAVASAGGQAANLIEKAGFKLTIKGSEADFSSMPIMHSGYVNGTGIIRIEQTVGKLKIVTYVWAPMILDFRVLIMVAHIPDGVNLGLELSYVSGFATALTTDLTPVRVSQVEGDDDWIGQVIIDHAGIPLEMLEKLKKEFSKAKPKLLLEAEQRWWMHWHRLGKIPANIIDKKYEVLLQSAALLKMAQSRETGPEFGKIATTLFSSQVGKSSPRDMAYSILALSRLGHFPEAKLALQFLLNADWNQLTDHSRIIRDPLTGRRDAVPLTRTIDSKFSALTNGHDESVFSLDSHGLVLWAAGDFMKRSSDVPFFQSSWGRIERRLIDPLLRSIDDSGLIGKDCGFADSPCPGEHHAFSSTSAFCGLNSAMLIAHAIGKEELANLYGKEAIILRERILSFLTVGKARVFAKSMETKDYPSFLDGSVVEAINWRVVDPQWNSAKSSIKAMEAFLRIGDLPRGFALGYNRTLGKGAENLFVSLRAIEALRMMGHKKRAEELLKWITDQASLNGEMIPEFFSIEEADYTGSYPLIGMGSGAFVLAVLPN